MRKTMKTAVLAAAMLVAGGGTLEAQDDASQELGPVELAPSASDSYDTQGGATAAAAAPAAQAGNFRVYGGLRIGVGGGFKLVDPDQNVLELASATPGIQAGAEYVLAKYFALGLETRFNWARARDDEERLMLWDLVLRPRSQYQLSSMPVELYGALPVGLSVPNFPDDSRVSGKAGATFGLNGGATYFFTEHIGLNAELGWLWHWLRAETESDATLKSRLGQLTLVSLNFVYAI